jgi:hypothetical protein
MLSPDQDPDTRDDEAIKASQLFPERIGKLLEIVDSYAVKGFTQTHAALDGLAAEVKGYVGNIQSGLDGVSGKSRDTDLQAIASSFERMVSNYLEVVRDVTTDQDRLANQAMKHSAEIESASRDLRRTAQQSKLVALNAIVSSQRVETGGPLTTIAQHMAKLNSDVERENAVISESAARLVEVLAKIPQLATELQGYSDKFGGDFRSRSIVTNKALADLRERKNAVLAEERKQAEQVLDAVTGATDRLHAIRKKLEACFGRLVSISEQMQRTMSEATVSLSPKTVTVVNEAINHGAQQKDPP